MRVASRFIAVIVCCVLPAVAVAQTSFLANLNGGAEVPPSPSGAFGFGAFAYVADSQMVTYSVSFVGIGTVTGIHVHGPAPAGENALVLFDLPIANPTFGVVGPITGQQVAELQAGLWYVNVHSIAYPSGEIRGQILEVTAAEPSTWTEVKALYAH